MIKYRCFARGCNIEKVDVVSQTERFVKLSNGRKDAKRSSGYNYFDSFDEAKEFLIEIAENKVRSLRLQLDRANGELGQIKGIKES
jgi:hypothetical protein